MPFFISLVWFKALKYLCPLKQAHVITFRFNKRVEVSSLDNFPNDRIIMVTWIVFLIKV